MAGGTKSREEKQQDFAQFILKQLDLSADDNRVIVCIEPAMKFISELSLSTVRRYFPQTESLFDEITVGNGEDTVQLDGSMRISPVA